VLAYDSTSSRGREQTKMAIRDRKVIDLGKDLPPASARGESLGLLKFEADGSKAMLEVAAHQVSEGHERAWVIEATRAVCKMVPLYGVNVAGLPWTEVDFPNDLEEARSKTWPAIERGRWGRTINWRRTRWLAAGIVALVVAIGGWFAAAHVGPASVDWESVAPRHPRPFPITVETGRQKWWLVVRGDSIVADVEGGAPLRIEFRLIMAPHQPDSGRYVVAVSVDGQPHDWAAFTATPDSTARLRGVVLGDRDRLQFVMPPGRHVVRVGLIAGHGDSLLVRIRRPE
jgi:hypothetical protein